MPRLSIEQLFTPPFVEEEYTVTETRTRRVLQLEPVIETAIELDPAIATDFEIDDPFREHMREQCSEPGVKTYSRAIEVLREQTRHALEVRTEAIAKGQRSALGWDTRGNEIVRAAYDEKRAAEKEAARAEREAERAARLAAIGESGG
jgi:hypothetical protein